MAIVNYGRQRVYHAAGNAIECRSCIHSIGSAKVPEGWIWCEEHDRQELATAHCTAFVREPGAD